MLSIIIPVYNEENNIKKIHEAICSSLKTDNFEILLIDDGSTDGSLREMKQLADQDERVRVFRHRTNLGKSEALNTGFRHAQGEITIIIDCDLEQHPRDINRMLDLIDQGYDVVNGWRHKRIHNPSRRLLSKIYNFITGKIFNISCHDFNCGLKVIRTIFIKDLVLHRGQHRYLIPILKSRGAKITEIPISHTIRKYGYSKYPSVRTLCVGTFDLIATKFQLSYLERPLLIFGSVGAIILAISLIVTCYLLYLKLAIGSIAPHYPLLIGTMTFFILSFQMLAIGIISHQIQLTHKLLRSIIHTNTSKYYAEYLKVLE